MGGGGEISCFMYHHDGLLAFIGRYSFLELLLMSHSYTCFRLTLESSGSIKAIRRGLAP